MACRAACFLEHGIYTAIAAAPGDRREQIRGGGAVKAFQVGHRAWDQGRPLSGSSLWEGGGYNGHGCCEERRLCMPDALRKEWMSSLHEAECPREMHLQLRRFAAVQCPPAPMSRQPHPDLSLLHARVLAGVP